MPNQETNLNRGIIIPDVDVILGDDQLINRYVEGKDIIVPMPVINELCQARYRSSENANSFLKLIESSQDGAVFNGGMSIGEGAGKLSVWGRDNFPDKTKSFKDDCEFKLAIAKLAKGNTDSPNDVTVLSRDIGLRIKALQQNLVARCDGFPEIKEEYEGFRELCQADKDLIDELYANKHEGVPAQATDFYPPLCPNEFVLLKNGSASVLTIFKVKKDDLLNGYLVRIKTESCFGVHPGDVRQICLNHALLSNDITVVTATGLAGTGKTHQIIAAMLEHERFYNVLLMARPEMIVGGEKSAFLPGDIQQKADPYMKPFYDNINAINRTLNSESKRAKVLNRLTVAKKPKKGEDARPEELKLQICPLPFIRGRTFTDSFCFYDEWQNEKWENGIAAITRPGENSKLVCSGDVTQRDDKSSTRQNNALAKTINLFRNYHAAAHINLKKCYRCERVDYINKNA